MSTRYESNEHRPSDPLRLPKTFADIAQQSSQLVTDFVKRQTPGGALFMGDELGVTKAFLDMTARMMQDPFKLAEAKMKLWQDYMPPVAVLDAEAHGRKPRAGRGADDGRPPLQARGLAAAFPLRLHQAVLPHRRAAPAPTMVGSVEGLDAQTAKKVDFYTRQYVDALAPTQFRRSPIPRCCARRWRRAGRTW